MVNTRVGRPKGTTGLAHVTIFSSDDLIRDRYPDALIGLIRVRQAARLSYVEMAPLLGMTPSQYGRLEKGTTRMLLKDARVVATFFGVKIEDLF